MCRKQQRPGRHLSVYLTNWKRLTPSLPGLFFPLTFLRLIDPPPS
jgi:hypothetical protein